MQHRMIGLMLAAMLLIESRAFTQHKSTYSAAYPPLKKVDIQRLFSSGKLHVDLLSLPPRIAELSVKMKASLDKHPAWMKAHEKELTTPHHMVPFSPELGLTHAEYDELAGFMKKGTGLAKVADGVIVVHVQGEFIELEGEGNTAFLNRVRIDLTANKVSTPYGKLNTMRVLPPNKQQKNNMWTGVEWILEIGPSLPSSASPSNYTSVGLSVGKYLYHKHAILIYGATKIENGRPQVNNVLMLKFALPK